METSLLQSFARIAELLMMSVVSLSFVFSASEDVSLIVLITERLALILFMLGGLVLWVTHVKMRRL